MSVLLIKEKREHSQSQCAGFPDAQEAGETALALSGLPLFPMVLP